MAESESMRPEMLEKLKEQLESSYVEHLPPLLGNDQAPKKAIKQVARAFNAFVLSKKFHLTEREACQYVTDDYEDNGIDAFFYNKQKSTLYLLQSKLKSEAVKQDEVLKFTQGVSLLLRKDFASFNRNFQNNRSVFESALDECESIVLALAYTGTGMTRSASVTLQCELASLQKQEDERLELKAKKFIGKHVEKHLTQVFAQDRVSETVALYHYSKLKKAGGIILGAMKVTDLVALHHKHGTALYDKNIRYFLGEGKKGVNAAIKKTLSSEPDKFVYLNNGITIIGEKINTKAVVSDSHPARNIKVNGLSVVNGAQTIASAAQCLGEEDLVSCNAMVTVTLIEAGNSADLHKQITRARNLQNPVELSDFVALDDTQERVRREIKLQGYEYHYRPQQGTEGAITIDVVAKALACLSDNPLYSAQLKTSSRSFEDVESKEYRAIFPADVSAVTIINAYHFFIKIKQLLENAEQTTESPEKLVYRHCLYPLSFIVLKYFAVVINNEILEPDRIDSMLSQPFDEIRQSFYDSFSRYETPHAFFKRQVDVGNLINKAIIHYLQLSNDVGVKALSTELGSFFYKGHNEKLTKYLLGQLKKKGYKK